MKIADIKEGRQGQPSGMQRLAQSFRSPIAIALAGGLAIVIAVVWSSDERDRRTLLRMRDGGLVLLQAAVVLLLCVVVVLLIVWLCKPERIMVREFENATDSTNLDGPAITSALAAELQRIRAIHEAQQDLQLPDPNASMPPYVLSSRERVADSTLSFVEPRASADNVAAVGTVEFAGASIPLGAVLVALRQLWPFRRTESVITGRLYRHHASLRLVMHLQGSNRKPSKEFVTSAPGEDFTSGFDMLIWSAAAYIAHELSPGQEMSWWSFGHFTDALEKYQDYVRTRDQHVLDVATTSALRIREVDRRAEKVRGLIYNLGLAHLENRNLTDAEKLLVRARRAAPDDAAAWNALGVCYFEQRRFLEARKAFDQATACKPKYPATLFDSGNFAAQPWNGLANTHVELAEYPKAVEYYQRAIALNPDAAYPYNGLGNAFLQQELWDKANEQYEIAISKDRAYAKPWHGKGNVSARRGHYDKALEFHREAVELDATLAAAWSGMGEAYARLHQMDEAMNAHHIAIDLRPHEPSPHQSLAETYLLQGKLVEAERELGIARDLDGGASYIWRTLGDLYCQKEEYAEAADAYRKAIERNSRNSRAWDGLARVTQDIEGQILAYQQAAETNDDEPWTWNQLGYAYYQARRFTDSFRAHARARRLDRKRGIENSYALNGMGKSLLALGRVDQALRCHRAALRAEPGNASAQHGIGAALLAKGDYRGALAEHRKAADLNPSEAFVWNGIGDSHERLRNYDDALTAYQKALECDERNAYTRSAIGRVLSERGQLAQALPECRRAVELDRASAGALIALAEVQYREGSYTEAIQTYRKALIIEPASLVAWDGVGRAYIRVGDYASAAQAYQPQAAVVGDVRRLHLGQADVSLARAASFVRTPADLPSANGNAGSVERNLAEAESLYRLCAAEDTDLALVARVRLAVIAAHRGDIAAREEHARAAAGAFSLAWDRRSHADPDLHEFHALAALLQGDVASALSRLGEATTMCHDFTWQFDSERVGIYTLLRDRGIEGFDGYLKAARPQLVEQDVQGAPSNPAVPTG